jgi:hypothetical protein
MSFLDELRASRSTSQSIWTQFVNSFRVGADDVYLFFEGKDDPAFYLCHLRRHATESLFIPLVCGGKKWVLSIIEKVKPRLDKEWRALFFVDKDIDDLVDGSAVLDAFCFQTTWYSIEQYLCHAEMLEVVWSDLFRLSILDARYPRVVDQYRACLNDFIVAIRPVMATAIWLRRQGHRPVLANVVMDDIIIFDTDFRVSAVSDWWPAVSKQAEVEAEVDWDAVGRIETQLAEVDSRTYVRGKWALWLFLSFVRKIESVLTGRLSDESDEAQRSRAKVTVQLTSANAVSLLSGRIDAPAELKQWIGKRLPASGILTGS